MIVGASASRSKLVHIALTVQDRELMTYQTETANRSEDPYQPYNTAMDTMYF